MLEQQEPSQTTMLEDQNDWGALSALPGNPLMWVLILSEIVVFSAFFVLFAWMRIQDREVFDASQQLLDPILGGANTLVLLTSGLFAALAVEAIARGQVRRCRQWLLVTMGLGLLFCIIKILEYVDKFSAGLTLETNHFFTFYYLLTGFHFAHVIFGLCLLAVVSLFHSRQNIETATAFWHMVDLIWILLYPIVYLLR